MAATVAGTRAPLSYCASFRAARMEAAIRSTRLRPSSTRISVSYSLFVRHQWDETENQVEVGGWLDRWNEGADIEGGGKCTRYAGHKGCAKTGKLPIHTRSTTLRIRRGFQGLGRSSYVCKSLIFLMRSQ